MPRQRHARVGTRDMLVRAEPRSVAASEAPLLDFLRRWWALLLVGTTLGAGVAYLATKAGPTSFQSSALIQVRPDPGSSRPATDAQIAAVGRARERMPPKTTFFWPKPRTGMVFRDVGA